MYSPNEQILELNNFIGGLNVTKPSTDINDNQTPDAANWMNNELAGINSRYGYTKYYATSLGSMAINKIFVYNTYNSSDFLFSYGTGLYLDNGGTSTTLLAAGMASGTVRSFELEGNMYFIDGTKYMQYNGTVATAVVGYIPTYKSGKSPDGSGGETLEELNFIQSAFTEEFNGNGTATTFYMTYGSLTTGNNTVLVNNATMVSGGATAGFTVNYTSGYITLTTAPTTGTNNVSIQVYKPVLDQTEIKACTFCATYGEGNNTYAFLSGNSSHPSRIYWSKILDASYYPSTSYADIGVKNDKMMGFLNYGGALQLWKNRSIHEFIGTPPNNSVIEIYNGEGCISTDTLRLSEGYPCSLSQRGLVYLEQNTLKLISEDINGRIGIRNGLMTETDAVKTSSFSYEFDNKLWLFIDDKIYIYQQDLKHQNNGSIVYPWLKWTTFSANCVIEKGGYLYWGGTGNIYKFDPTSSSDDGVAISAYYYSKKHEIEKTHDWVKWFLNIFFNFRTQLGTNFSATVTIYIDDKEVSISNGTISLSYWNPNSFNPNSFLPNATEQWIENRMPLHKKGKYIQYKITSATLNNLFTLLGSKITYIKDRKVR